MENLNAEQIIKAFEVCRDKDLCNECPYEENIDCLRLREKHAIALMKSQEQKIFELENRLKECENGYEGTLFLDRCKLHDAEEKVKELTEENNFLKEELRNATAEVFMLRERNADLHASCTELERKCESLDDENERLRGILLQFTDIVHKWGNKNGYDTSEISLVPILNEANTIKSQIEADTVRKMQERLKYAPIKVGLPLFGLQTKDEIVDYANELLLQIGDAIDQIAKEMLEVKNENND